MTYCKKNVASIFYTEDGIDYLLRNIGNHVRTRVSVSRAFAVHLNEHFNTSVITPQLKYLHEEADFANRYAGIFRIAGHIFNSDRDKRLFGQPISVLIQD